MSAPALARIFHARSESHRHAVDAPAPEIPGYCKTAPDRGVVDDFRVRTHPQGKGGFALGPSIPRGALSLAGSLPARALLGLIWIYRHTLSPLLPAVFGPSCGCRFHPTCSQYAAEAVRAHGPLAGGWLALRRLLKCHPWHPGGFDPVPPSPRLRRTGPPVRRQPVDHAALGPALKQP